MQRLELRRTGRWRTTSLGARRSALGVRRSAFGARRENSGKRTSGSGKPFSSTRSGSAGTEPKETNHSRAEHVSFNELASARARPRPLRASSTASTAVSSRQRLADRQTFIRRRYSSCRVRPRTAQASPR
jgi:hypothetical protein